MTRPRAFFVGKFGGIYDFIFDAIKDLLAHNGDPLGPIDLQPVREVADEDSGDLHRGIARAINEAHLVIANITPQPADPAIWNPNVMFELGKAKQAGTPACIICESHFMPEGPKKLPFDISTDEVMPFVFSPPGLRDLAEKMRAWIRRKTPQILAYRCSHDYICSFRDTRDILCKWDVKAHAQFGPLVRRITDFMRSTITDVTQFVRHPTDKGFPFEPPSRAEMIDILFASAIEQMTDGDSYLTVSTLRFWRNLGIVPGVLGRDTNEQRFGRFFAATAKALERHVAVRRLFVVPYPHDLARERVDLGILAEHLQMERRYERCYETRCRVVKAGRSDDGKHFGVCRFQSGVVTALRPAYDERTGNLTGIEYLPNGDVYLKSFEDEWESGKNVTLKEYIGKVTEHLPGGRIGGDPKRSKRRSAGRETGHGDADQPAK